MNKKQLTYLFAGIAIALIAIVLLVSNGTTNPVIENNQNQEDNSNDTKSAVDRSVAIEVGDTEFSFAPEDLRVAKGSTVEFEFTNTGQFPHNFKVETADGELLGGTKTISSGATDTFILTMPNRETTITLVSFCSVPGHREGGMVGKIVVE